MSIGLMATALHPRQLIRRGMSVVVPHRLFMVSGPSSSRRVTLTFDDGPHPEHTPILLDRLKALGIPATFFVLGRQAERHPDLVRRMASEGHDVGHHSFTHTEPAHTSALQLLAEARQAVTLLAPLIGHRPRLFRPPHGKLTMSKALALWSARQSIVLWNQDPKDFACGSASALREWFSTRSFSGGDIVLLHDVHPFAAEVLATIADRVAARDLTFGRISDWVHA